MIWGPRVRGFRAILSAGYLEINRAVREGPRKA